MSGTKTWVLAALWSRPYSSANGDKRAAVGEKEKSSREALQGIRFGTRCRLDKSLSESGRSQLEEKQFPQTHRVARP